MAAATLTDDDYTFGLPMLPGLAERMTFRLTRVERSVIGNALRRHGVVGGTEAYLKGVLVDLIETSNVPNFGIEGDIEPYAYGVRVLTDLPPFEYLTLSRGQRTLIFHALRSTLAVGSAERWDLTVLRERIAGIR